MSAEFELALEFAAAQLPVFPVDLFFDPARQRWRKLPCIKDWERRATVDTAMLRGWWRGWPTAMPGIPPGRINKVIVDADRHGGPDGVALFAELDHQHGPFPPHPIIVTKSGGEHHWFSQPATRISYATWTGGELHGHRRFVVGYALPQGEMPELPAVFWKSLGPKGTHMGSTVAGSQVISTAVANGVAAGGLAAVEPMCVATKHQRNYAALALRNHTGELWMCRQGQRNSKLNVLAYNMGRMVVRGWIERERVEQSLLLACRKNGLLDDDGVEQCLATLASGINAGLLRPYHDVD